MISYIPDSVYTMCGEYTEDCKECSNNVYSNVVGGMVHDSQTGKVFCPFGKLDTMNQSIFNDQSTLNKSANTTWGRAPQADPRSLTKIG